MVLTFSGALNAVYADSATWSLNPISKDWNTAANWMPPTVPNGSADTATFGVSNVLDPRLRFRHEAVEVNGIVFTPDASAFTIVLNHASLLITGSGVSNNSGVVQNFFAGAGAVNFYGTASAGSLTVYTNGGGTQSDVPGGVVNFSDDATADDATFINLRPNGGLFGGETVFFDNSSIGNATVINDGGADTTVFSAAVGGNPTIVNRWDSNWLRGTPSVGLMQVIGPTFRAYAGRLRNVGPFSYGVSTNPLANIYASMQYALSRYGSLPSAYNRRGGYDQGGPLYPGYTLAYNGTGQTEWVVNGKQFEALTRRQTSDGGITQNVYPAPGMDEVALANKTARRLGLALGV